MRDSLPPEFSEAVIAACSVDIDTPYRDFVNSREPYRSLLRANPWMKTPRQETHSSGERVSTTTRLFPINMIIEGFPYPHQQRILRSAARLLRVGLPSN